MKEDHSDHARSFVDHMLAVGGEYLAPSIVLYGSLSAALHVEVPPGNGRQAFRGISCLEPRHRGPTSADLKLAETIARTQSPVGGYPTLFDSIYHAMAIQRGGVFVTADARHVAKAEQYGHITLLADWQPD